MGRLRHRLQGQKIYLDANIFIYAIEMTAPWFDELNDVFQGLSAGEFSAVTSSLCLSECLVQPFKRNRQDLVQIYRLALLPRAYLSIASIDDPVLLLAASIRAQIGLKLPDAIHAATALTQNCTAMLTNDMGFKRASDIEILLLSDWVSSC